MIVAFTQSARADIAAIYDYIAPDSPTAARRVASAIERATHRLSTFPQSGRIGAVETTREIVVPRLPFIAVYRITSDAVEVIAVFHAAQDKPRGG
jgi:toxin ParE1/3/4